MNGASLLPDLSMGVFRVWRRNLDSFRGYYLAAMVANVGEHLIYLLGMGIGVGAYVRLGGDASYLQFIAPGLVASSAMWSSSMECTYGAFTRTVSLPPSVDPASVEASFADGVLTIRLRKRAQDEAPPA